MAGASVAERVVCCFPVLLATERWELHIAAFGNPISIAHFFVREVLDNGLLHLSVRLLLTQPLDLLAHRFYSPDHMSVKRILLEL